MGLLGYGVTTLVTVAFALYLANSFYTFYNLFHPVVCPERSPEGSCVHPYFSRSSLTKDFPSLGLHIRVSDNSDPFASSSYEVYKNVEWKVEDGFEFVKEVKLPARARRNGTLYGHVILLMNEYRKEDPKYVEEKLVRTVKLTSYKIPDATAFNLITDSTSTDSNGNPKKPLSRRPVSHLRSKLFVTLVNEDPAYPVRELPSEVIGLMQIERIENNYYYWPLFHVDEMSTRLADLTEQFAAFFQVDTRFEGSVFSDDTASHVFEDERRLWEQG
uniref:Lipid scramblase CLPTM1L n=1 Tax=Panagrellus redivivus TaxID=6233 RepID=A0A7E4WCC4_PANRE